MLSFIRNWFWAPRQSENSSASPQEAGENRKRKASATNPSIDVKKPRGSENTCHVRLNLDIEQADYRFSRDTISVFKGSGSTVLISQGLYSASAAAPLLLQKSFFTQPASELAAAFGSSSSRVSHSKLRHSLNASCWQHRSAVSPAAISVLGRVDNLPAFRQPLVSPTLPSQSHAAAKSASAFATSAAAAAAAAAALSGVKPCVHSTPLVRPAMSGKSSSPAKLPGLAAASTVPKSRGPQQTGQVAAAASDAGSQQCPARDANDDDDCVITSVEGPKSVAEFLSPCSKYLTSDWLSDIKTSSQSLKSYMQKVESEETLKMQYWAKQRESDERDLVARVTRNLKLAERELPVLPYKYEEPPPTPPPSPPPEEPSEPEFPDLSESQLGAVERAWSRQLPGSEVVAEGFSLRVTRDEIRSLVGLNWLNDNIVNFYMQLIAAREGPGLPRVHAFSTFFYTKFSSSGYASVRRWTKKVDIFDRDVLLCPVHLHNNHWTLCIVDLRSRHIIHLDSLSRGGSGADPTCLPLMRRYLGEEHKDKKGRELDAGEFQLVRDAGAPQQENGSDCGVFCCKFADYYCKGREFTFGQPHMPYFRKRATLEILEKRLLW